MKVSAAALPVLILAAALGPPAHGARGGEFESLNRGLISEIQVPDHPLIGQGGMHHPTDCCLSYTPRTIRCAFMESYYETSGGCSKPAVIFTTKKGQEVCVHPGAGGVRECMIKLASKNALGRLYVERKPQ